MRKIFAVLAALICCLSVWTSVPAAQAFTLDKEDGEYSIQVELEGGSGKASVTSPTLITVKNGEVTADIQWSKKDEPDYELMERLAKDIDIPVIGEGKIHYPDQAVKALQTGAWAIVVGGAITRPLEIAQRFQNAIKESK